MQGAVLAQNGAHDALNRAVCHSFYKEEWLLALLCMWLTLFHIAVAASITAV